MKEIEQYAIQFRDAIDTAKEMGDFDNNHLFRRFPSGCCGDASDLLAQYFIENGIGSHYVCGTYRPRNAENIQTHAWLLLDNRIIVDITGDQFMHNPNFFNYAEKVYVGATDGFHRLFKLDKFSIRENIGLDAFNDAARSRLFEIYNIIKQYLK